MFIYHCKNRLVVLTADLECYHMVAWFTG